MWPADERVAYVTLPLYSTESTSSPAVMMFSSSKSLRFIPPPGLPAISESHMIPARHSLLHASYLYASEASMSSQSTLNSYFDLHGISLGLGL